MNFKIYLENNLSKFDFFLSNQVSSQWTIYGENHSMVECFRFLNEKYPDRMIEKGIKKDRYQIEKKINNFFIDADQKDINCIFPITAGVPLAIPDWADVEKLFYINTSLEKNKKIAILISKNISKRKIKIVYEKIKLNFYNFRIMMTLLHLIKTLARKFFCNKVHIEKRSKIFWISVGGFLTKEQFDPYFGKWLWQSKHEPLRLYQQGGKGLRLNCSKNQVPYEFLLHWVDIFSALIDVWIAVKMCYELKPDSFNKRLLRQLWLDEINRGDVYKLALQKLAWKRMLKDFSPKAVIFPFEARAWECSLVTQAKALGILTVGYQHSSLTPRHRSIFNRQTTDSIEKLPDKVITCGEITANRLIKSSPFAYSDRLCIGAAMRMGEMQILNPGKKILVTFSSSRSEAFRLFNFFFNVVGNGLNSHLIFRPHPTIQVKEIFEKFNWPIGTIYSENRSLEQDISESLCIAYSSSTVVIQGMQYGRIPLYIDIGDILSGDPLDDAVDFKLQVNNPEQTIKILNLLMGSRIRKNELANSAKAYSLKYLVKPTKSHISEMNKLIDVI